MSQSAEYFKTSGHILINKTRYMNLLNLILFTLLLSNYARPEIDVSKCGYKLLDDLVLVPDSAFTASSSFQHKLKTDRKMDLSPKAARESYDKDNQEFAWCPKDKVSSDLKEYLEIDMGRLTVINFAQTRGRFAQGAGKEYVPFYKVHYRREQRERWRLYKKFDPLMGFSELLKGPSDPFLDAYETLDPPIIARWIRIYPYSFELMRVCMKVQLYGCTFGSGVLEYRIPQGSEPTKSFINTPGIMPTFIKVFQDSSYDGPYDQGLLHGGLGRLTDYKIGGDFISLPSEAQHFVGWNVKFVPSSADQTLTLWFRFDSLRNFSHVKLNGFNNQTMKIAHPTKLEVKFSILGEVFNDVDTIVTNSTSSFDKSPVSTQFNLHHRIGQFLLLKLHFQSDWILLSEIYFKSEKAIAYQIDKKRKTNPELVTEVVYIKDNAQSHIKSNMSVDVIYIITIVVCIVLSAIVVIIVFWCIMRHRRIKRKRDEKKKDIAYYSQKPFGTIDSFPNTQIALHPMTNPYKTNYTAGSLQLPQSPPMGSHTDAWLFSQKMNSQNYMTNQKKSIPTNDSNIYTSIPGSDNDSSLSTDYMASSGGNSAHPYAQTMPVTYTTDDHLNNEIQIISNPLFDGQPFIPSKPGGMHPFEANLFGISQYPFYGTTTVNPQSFSGSNVYVPMEYSASPLDKSFYPAQNSYQEDL